MSEQSRAELEAEFDDMAYRFSCLLDHATGGRMSKTNYTKEVMYSGVNEHIRQCIDDEKSEIIEDIVDKCETVVDDVIDGCREEGANDLRQVKSRIHTAFCLIRGETV